MGKPHVLDLCYENQSCDQLLAMILGQTLTFAVTYQVEVMALAQAGGGAEV